MAGRWLGRRPTVLVNLGANDVGFCDDTVGCEAAVRYVMERIGDGPTVLWPLISHFFPADSQMWNAALERVAADHPNLVLWDWPSARAANNIPIASDNIHLPYPAAYAQRSTLLAEALLDAVSGAQPSGIAAPVAVAAGQPSTYEPIAPVRDPRHPPEPPDARGARSPSISPRASPQGRSLPRSTSPRPTPQPTGT